MTDPGDLTLKLTSLEIDVRSCQSAIGALMYPMMRLLGTRPSLRTRSRHSGDTQPSP
jgi:hypothetical protein